MNMFVHQTAQAAYQLGNEETYGEFWSALARNIITGRGKKNTM